MCARFLLQNAYVLESDLLLKNAGLIKKYHYSNNYLGVHVERTDDWCFETRNGIITRVRVGGRNCHHMFGIYYWNERDGAKLSSHLKEVYEMPGGKDATKIKRPLNTLSKNYSIEARECGFDDIIEIDTFNELKKLDETYRV